jgi:hypothetical protein
MFVDLCRARGRFGDEGAGAVSLPGVEPRAFAILAKTEIVRFLSRRSTWLM